VTGAKTIPPRVFTKILYPSLGELHRRSGKAAGRATFVDRRDGSIQHFRHLLSENSTGHVGETSGGKATTISMGREGYFPATRMELSPKKKIPAHQSECRQNPFV
jgi:hypothetical protein